MEFTIYIEGHGTIFETNNEEAALASFEYYTHASETGIGPFADKKVVMTHADDDGFLPNKG
tara:strand:+ start:2159 stop:2341 length:183 start_codon:yes stop_codon:yes gene_type:complete